MAQVNAVDEGMEEPAMSQPAPSVGPRSLSSPPGAMRRKGRGSNLRGGSSKSTPPPPQLQAPAAATATPAPVAPAAEARAEAPVPVVARAHEEHTAHADEPPVSAPPPASDLDERFFHRGDTHEAHDHDAHDLDHLDHDDPRMAQKNSPEARARREKNWMYIRVAAGICVTLMAVALLRSSMHHTPEPVAEPPVVVTVIGQQPNAVVPKAEIPAAPPASAAAPAASTGEPGAAASASAAVAAGSPPIPTASADEILAAPTGSAKFQEPVAMLGAAAKGQGTDPATAPAAGAPVVADPTEAEKKSAAQEKRACQSLLDQGAFAKAVEAGERSVQLDPSDGEAWLMLGAAYQSMGKGAEARRAFSSCVAEGKKGPIGDCRAMLR